MNFFVIFSIPILNLRKVPSTKKVTTQILLESYDNRYLINYRLAYKANFCYTLKVFSVCSIKNVVRIIFLKMQRVMKFVLLYLKNDKVDFLKHPKQKSNTLLMKDLKNFLLIFLMLFKNNIEVLWVLIYFWSILPAVFVLFYRKPWKHLTVHLTGQV